MFSLLVFFFKQKTAYEMRISDCSSDVCSSDLDERARVPAVLVERQLHDIGLLLLQIFEKRRLVLAPVVDLDRHAASVAARIGDAVPGGERSEWRRVGKEGVSTCRSRGSPSHLKNKISLTSITYCRKCY